MNSSVSKIILFVICSIIISVMSGAKAQEPVLKIDFENFSEYSTDGTLGKALDLGPSSPKRRAIKIKNPLKDLNKNFTITLWVKSYILSKEDYVIISSMWMFDNQINGWKIGVQQNGAWKFEVQVKDVKYEYSPSFGRQTIRDDDWHLLGVTYSEDKEELKFYYDGEKVAIYYAPDIKGFYNDNAPDLIVGNSIENDEGFGYLESGWNSFLGWIDDINLYDEVLSDGFINDYYFQGTEIQKENSDISKTPSSIFKVAAFNIWHGGNEIGKEVGKQRVIEILKKMEADVYLLVETYGSGAEIADALNSELYLISSNLSIISKYPIIETYQVYQAFHCGGVRVGLPKGESVNLFCTWLSSKPQYFISGLTEQEGWPVDSFLLEDEKTRGKDITSILEEIEKYVELADSIPLIVGGDFNSGSHLDWVAETMSSHNGYVVPWPASVAMQKAGFNDSYRNIYPDPHNDPGITWSPTRKFPLKDRIDYIYYKGVKLQIVQSDVWDEHPVYWPSDHAAVLSTFKLNR